MGVFSLFELLLVMFTLYAILKFEGGDKNFSSYPVFSCGISI